MTRCVPFYKVLGAARVALVCVLLELAGQLPIWKADGAVMAYAGAALTGFGHSLAFAGRTSG